MKLAQTPGERLERAIYAAAALAGVRGTEPELPGGSGTYVVTAAAALAFNDPATAKQFQP